ncbi:MAG: Hsp20/alpha crystallin family protein [Thermoplasmata archaeon]|nr:Hsp20/alpha crystallin family protein [Thermoplasmata archaeon]
MFDDKKKKKDDKDEFEKLFKEMEKFIEDVFKNAFNMQPFVKGYSVRINEDGVPEIKEIGGKDENEEIMEDEKKIYVTLEIPEIDEKEIEINAKNNVLEIKAGDFAKKIELPSKVNSEKIVKSYRNGILDIELEKV